MKPRIAALTERIRVRSAPLRQAYLARLQKLADRPPGAQRMGCANVAHAFAAMPGDQRLRVVAERAPHLAVVTAYNDMLSAHQPYEGYPALIRRRGAPPRRHGAGGRRRAGHVRRRHPGPAGHGAVAVLARHHRHGHGGGAHARRVRRRTVAGRVRQDRARPADRGAALRPPALCLRARGADVHRAVQRRQEQGARAGRPGPGRAAASCWRPSRQAYHSAGTCTFYGTANSNQMLLEAMGLHVPGAAFIHPHDAAARGPHPRSRGHGAGHHAGARRYTPDRPVGGRARDRQRHGGAAGHRWAPPTT